MNNYYSDQNFKEWVKQSGDSEQDLTYETRRYLDIFKKFTDPDRSYLWFLTWNWPAALLGPLWFAYRRMYFAAFIVNLSYFIQPSNNSETSSIAINCLCWIFCSALANFCYFAHVTDWIKDNQLHKKGPSGIATGVYLLLLVILAFILNKCGLITENF